MYILRILCGGLSYRCNHAWSWIGGGELQREQSDSPHRTDAGAGSGAYGSQSGVCAIRNGCRRDRELANFKFLLPNAGPQRDRRCCLEPVLSSQFSVLSEYASVRIGLRTEN